MKNNFAQNVSIVTVACNALRYSKLCLNSIKLHTPPGYQLILVDNGSTDGTREYFSSIPGGIVINNEKNLGFAKGYNQGVKASTREIIVIINNDCVVGPNWLTNMLACAAHDSEIGMVGPRGNNINGRQRFEQQFSSVEKFYAFVKAFNKLNPEKWFEVTRLVGFCLLIKRETIGKVGYFDEAYGLGTREDIDYSIRVRLAGFKQYCAGDVFVHHFCHRTFFENDIDVKEIYMRNSSILRNKWGVLS